jgi:hypothetical protein
MLRLLMPEMIPQSALGGSIVATGTPDSISWTSIPSGFTSSDSFPSDTPKVSTQYILKVTYSTTSTVIYDTINVTVTNPFIDAGRDTILCLGQSIQLGGSIVATASPVSFSWTSIPSGFTSTDSTPTASPVLSTDYILAVSYAYCTLYDTTTVIVPILNANFGLSEDTVCSGTSISFYDSTANNSSNATYAWNFGNSTSSNLQNPSQTFTTSSTGSGSTSYTVILTVSDSGCTSIDTSYILVKNLPDSYHADYDGNAYTNCVGVPAYTLTSHHQQALTIYTLLFGGMVTPLIYQALLANMTLPFIIIMLRVISI